MIKLILTRDSITSIQTLGKLQVVDEKGNELFSCFTLELPWRGNQRSISCIPMGEYKVVHRKSAKFGNHLHILDVPGRDYILMHPANFVSQLQGCIAVGDKRMDLNGDQIIDLANSKKTMNALLTLVKSGSKLIIE